MRLISSVVSSMICLEVVICSNFVSKAGIGLGEVLKRATNEQRLMGPGPSDGWIKIGGITDQMGVLLIKHETFQSLFPPNLLASGEGGGGGGGGQLKIFTVFVNFR